jgi:hypothetical protein
LCQGLFDRFLKNYTSSSSIQDEPDLSFVSSHHSPTKADKADKADSTASLIQRQQRQLSQQFADVSPINGRRAPGGECSADRTRFETLVNYSDLQSTKLTAANLEQDFTKSLLLFSPKR